MKEQLEKIRQEALSALAGVNDAGELDALRVRFLGKKGELTGVLKMMGKLSAEERPVMGQAANNVRAAIDEKMETVRAERLLPDLFQLFFHKRRSPFRDNTKCKKNALRPESGRKTRLPRYHPLFAENLRCF